MSVLKTFDIALDTKKALYGSRITLVESDTGNRFVITLTDDGTAVDLTGCRVSVVFSGAMGTAMQDSWTGTGNVTISGTSNNIITIDVHSGSFATGLNTCEIQVYSGATYTTLITSARFTFNAQKPILDDETIVSTDSYPTLVYWADKLEALTEREQADWTEADNTKGTYIQNKPVVGTDYQDATQNLTAETTLADADTVPFYDASASAHRKSTWANIKSVLSLVFAGITHASRHLIGGADALNAMPYDAASTTLLINGGFSINQLAKTGTVTLAAGAYGHDMWKAGASGCTYTFATSENVTTLTISAGSLLQIVEGANLKSGTVCLSWTGTAQGKIGAGSYSASGVTGSATGGTNLKVEFNTGTLRAVQLNYGSVALPFVPRAFGDELRMCQRYFEKSYDYPVAPGSTGAGVGLWFVNVLAAETAANARWPVGAHPRFAVSKRTAPTVTLYEYGGTVGSWSIGGAVRATASSPSENGFTIMNNTGGSVTPTAGEAYGHWTADAEL